jgi:lysophospholipase L1-like esterase
MKREEYGYMKVVGFGACMIAGYPLGEENSFFTLLVNRLRNDWKTQIDTEVISLGGFPLNRAKKYFESKVLRTNPDVIIMQFASADVHMQLRTHMAKIWLVLKRLDNAKSIITDTNTGLQQFSWNPKKYILYVLKFILCRMLKAEPVNTSIDEIRNYVDEIAKKCIDNNIRLILLSHFVQADMAQNYWAKRYATEIQNIASRHNILFIDCHQTLSRFKKKYILLSDGFHLSKKGHQVVMQAIYSQWNEPE